MKRFTGFFLIVIGSILIVISIVGLIQAYDIFSTLNSSIENIGYTIGSIVFPLLITVSGRWIFRKGVILLRKAT